MYKRRRWIERRKKVFAALVAVFILCNVFMVTVTPVFASAGSSQAPAGAMLCLPIISPCTPTPTPTRTGTPTATPTGSPTPGPTGTPTGSPTPGPTGTPIPPPMHLADSSSFTLTATQIVGTDAHLSFLPDPSHPVLTFSSVTITGLKITHLSFTISATGTATGTGVSIKTSLFQELMSALGSFTNPADLLILTAGGTVHTLTMKNVSLQIDRYIDAQSFTINGLHLSA